MTPSHHLPEELLLAYAAGSLEEAEALLVAVHASLCPRCAQRVGEFEQLGGALLELQPASAVSDDLLARALAQLDTFKPLSPPSPVDDPVLPAPLVRLTGPFDRISWVKTLPNTYTLELPITLSGMPVRLRRFRAGAEIPMHTHTAIEYDLILSGGVTDRSDGRHFQRGDVSVNDESVTHRLTIDLDTECVALSVHSGRLKPLGLWARLVCAYTGW